MKELTASDPRSLGSYRPRAVLGEGGMGRVLLATGADGALVAIKMVHAHLAGDEEFRRRFRREVAATRTVAGDHVAPVVAAEPDADTPWLASGFVHGPTLREVLEEGGSLPQDAVLRLAAGLASALRDIHAAGLVHRDLSPSNVLLAEDGPKVIDFGIVRATDGAATARHHSRTTTITHVGSVIGAPGFMSPEQASGQSLTPATDVFSLGVVLFEAHTGENPFAGPGIPQVLYNVVHTHPDLDALPEPLRRIIEPCLAKDPEQRPTPAQLLELLDPDSEAPPPWPPEVDRLAERQQAEIHRLVAATDETRDLSRSPHTPTHAPTHAKTVSLTQASTQDATPPDTGGGPRSRKRLLLSVIGAALAVSLTIVLVAVAVTNGGDGATADATDPADSAEDAEAAAAAEEASEAIRAAEEGDCFDNDGTLDDVELTPTSCTNDTFEVLRAFPGADSSACDGTRFSDLTAAFPEEDTTLCLQYRHTYSEVYPAAQGDCVGRDINYSWQEMACDEGNFTVVERLEGTSDEAGCDSSPPGSHTLPISMGPWQALDVVLCLSMIYEDDIGYAEPGDCLHRHGSGETRVFEFADCGSPDAYVVTKRDSGASDHDNASEFCGDDAFTARYFSGFSNLSYTVCYRSV